MLASMFSILIYILKNLNHLSSLFINSRSFALSFEGSPWVQLFLLWSSSEKNMLHKL